MLGTAVPEPVEDESRQVGGTTFRPVGVEYRPPLTPAVASASEYQLHPHTEDSRRADPVWVPSPSRRCNSPAQTPRELARNPRRLCRPPVVCAIAADPLSSCAVTMICTFVATQSLSLRCGELVELLPTDLEADASSVKTRNVGASRERLCRSSLIIMARVRSEGSLRSACGTGQFRATLFR